MTKGSSYIARRDKLAMFAITVYVILLFICTHIWIHIHRYFPLYDALTGCNAERLSELLISEKFKSLI